MPTASDHTLDAMVYAGGIVDESGFNRRFPQNELRAAVRRERIKAGLEKPEPTNPTTIEGIADILKHTYSSYVKRSMNEGNTLYRMMKGK